jgi:GT2 family glycosyltransferase
VLDSTPLARLLAAPVQEARTDRTYPGGTIGVLSTDLARYASFAMSLLGVKYPWGTSISWQRGADICHSCNRLVREMTGDWLWILGDDHVFDTDLLLRLLSRMYDDGCDLVAPLVLGRAAPFPTVIGVLGADGRSLSPKPIAECQGRFEVDAVGSAGLLVRRAVLTAMADPWFEASRLTRGALGEDWWFCLQARRAGFTIWVDADTTMGHTTSMTLWPYHTGSTSGVRLDLGGGFNLAVQQVTPTPEVVDA